MLNYFIEAKVHKLAELVIPNCFSINLTMCGLPSIMNSSSHKTWQTFLFLNPLQIQNLKRKKWWDMACYAPLRLKMWGDTSPVSHTKLRPWLNYGNSPQQTQLFTQMPELRL